MLVPSIVITVQFLLAALLFWRAVPMREHPLARGLLCAGAFLVVGSLITWEGLTFSYEHSETTFVVIKSVTFVATFSLMVAGFLACFKTSLWVALFCCVAAYIIQNLSNSGVAYLSAIFEQPLSPLSLDVRFPLVSALSTLVVYPIAHRRFVSSIERGGAIEVDNKHATLMFLLVVAVGIIFDATISHLAEMGVPVAMTTLLRVVHDLLCIFILYTEYELLYNRRVREDLLAMNRLRADELRHYQLTRQSIDAVNCKVHDLRHRLEDLERLGSISQDEATELMRDLHIYDTSIVTGNEVVDTILSEKGLLCEREGVELSCMADGPSLSFMSPTDAYALFGNALDNAMEAALMVTEQEKRSISLVVRRRGDMACIQVRNYYAEPLTLVDGLPQTTKDRREHGYGTRSIRATAERYGGTATFSAADGTFCLDVLIPLHDSVEGLT